MAKKIDPKNLTIDFKQLLGIPVQDRISLWQSGGQSYFESLTPEQLSRLFPKYYQRQLPDIGKAVSGGTAGTSVSAPSAGVPKGTSTSSATSSATGTPTGKKEQATQQTRPSAPAEENAFLKHLQSITGKTDKQTYQTSGIGIDRSRFKKELENNPELAQRIMSLAKAEVGSQGPSAQQKWMETIFNRAYAQKRSLAQVIDPNNGYWPRGQKRPQLSKAELDAYQSTLGRVVAGSNESNYATDNASAGLARRRQQSGRVGTWDNGEFFYIDFHYRKAMENLRAETEQRAQQKATETQKPQQERPSQSDAATGLTPESPTPGKAGTTGTYSHPLGEQGAKVTSGYGMRVHPVHGIKRMHTGVDMRVAMGTPIQSVAEGKVIFAGTKGGYGYTVDVQHADGTVSRYAHLSEFRAKVGDNIKTGQVIALSGGAKAHPGSGTSTGPHLHFEIRRDNKAIDPTPYLQQQMPAPVSANVESEQKTLSRPQDYDSWNPNLKKYIESLPPSTQQKIFDQSNELVRQGKGHINDIYSSLVQQNTNMFSTAPKVVTDAVKNAPPGELPSNFDPNDPIGSLANVRDPSNPKRPGRQDPQGLYTESEFYADMENRKGSPFNYALTEQGRKEFGDRAQNIVTIQTNSGKKLSVNAAAAGDFKQFIDEIEARGYKVKDLGGYNNRDNVNAPGKPSTHAFGTAIDINPGQNPNKPRIPGQTDMPENIKYVAMKYGLAQIGSDRMHFERVSPALRKVYVQRLIQQGWIKPDDPVVQQRIQEGIITQEEINKIKISPVVNQPPTTQAPTQTGTPPTQVLQAEQPVPAKVSPAAPTPVTPAAPPVPGPAAPPVPGPAAQPAPGPAAQPAPTAVPATPSATQTTQTTSTAQPAPVSEAPPRQEDQVKPNATGGQEQTTENIGFFDTNTGKNLGTASRGEVVALNESGIADIKPEQRITEIPQLRNDVPQQQEQTQQQEMPTNAAGMISQPMQQTAEAAPSAQQVFAAMMEAPGNSNNPSYRRAVEQYSFRTTDRKYGFDSGFNTLFK